MCAAQGGASWAAFSETSLINPHTPLNPPSHPTHPHKTPRSEREKFFGLLGFSLVVAFFLSSIGAVLFYALALGVAAVALHGAMRVPDDLFLDETVPEVRALLAAWWVCEGKAGVLDMQGQAGREEVGCSKESARPDGTTHRFWRTIPVHPSGHACPAQRATP